MLNFLQSPSKLKICCLLLIFLAIFLTNTTLAFRLSASPPEMHFKTKPGEFICQNLKLKGDGLPNLLKIYDKWSTNPMRDISLYDKNAEDLGIESKYARDITIFLEDDLLVCLKANQSGYFHGVLFLEAENADAGLGIWIKLDVNLPSQGEENKENLYFFYVLGLVEIIFLAILIVITLFMDRLSLTK